MTDEMSENSVNRRHSLTDDSESHKKQMLLPIRIKAVLEMYENSDDDFDNKNDDSEEENEVDDCPPVAQINEIPALYDDKDGFKQCVQDLVMESSKSKSDSVKQEHSSNSRKLCNYPLFTSEPSVSWKNYVEEKHHRGASASKELFHSENNSKPRTRTSQPINEFTSDFGRMEIDGSEIISGPETFMAQVQAESSVTSIKQSSTDLTSLKCETGILAESCYSTKTNNKTSSEAPEISSRHSTIDKHIHGVASYKSDPGIVPSGSSQRSNSTLVADTESSNPPGTPLKLHSITSSRRPMHSTSRRTIFQTPQGKISTDFPNTAHEQTPASIFSTWRHANIMHTPLQNRIEPDMEAPGKSLMAKNETPWKLQSGEKRVRRPLEETMPSEPTRPPTDNIEHVSHNKDTNVASGVNVKQKNVETSLNYELKENLGPVCVELPGKMSDQLQSPGGKNMKTTCPLSECPPAIQIHNKKSAKQSPDKPAAYQPMSVAPPNVPCQYGTRMSIKGKEYIILGILGQGMSGEVYRVQDLSNLELKAIKYVNLARMDQESAQSCLNEIKMLNKLQAPCVVKMHDHEVKNQSIYVVMEMGDTDLSRFLKSLAAERRRLPLTMILHYWTEMLTAVKHIHDNGVIHSDLKPANFLLVRGRLKLIDFGISSSLNAEMTSVVKSTTVGTLNYISPEALMDVGGSGDSPQQNNKYKISYKSDVWSLGCILYSLVYGNTPFQNIRQQWAKINAITNPNPSISYNLPPHVENVPSILIDVIKKCLQHDPKARPSVDQLLQVQYISMAKNVPINSPDVPPSILRKIKNTLEDTEWRLFTEVLGQLRPH